MSEAAISTHSLSQLELGAGLAEANQVLEQTGGDRKGRPEGVLRPQLEISSLQHLNPIQTMSTTEGREVRHTLAASGVSAGRTYSRA